jgi:hypothetical protein
MTSQLERIAPRPVTSEELAFFDEHGWVKLEQLIPAQQAGVLLERHKEKMGEHGLDGEHPDGDATTARWRVFAPLSVDKVTGAVRDDLYHSFSHSPELGRVGEAFLGGPVRYWIDQALVKAPAGEAGSGETSWHIDIGDKGTSPFDPPAQINIWIALADVTAEHGSMRFVSPKDLTDEIKQSVEGRPVEETIPELERLGIVSERLDLRPGDATVHAGLTFHSAPPNRTSSARWGYFVSLVPAGTRYSGVPYWPMVDVADVEVGKPFPDFRFPVL